MIGNDIVDLKTISTKWQCRRFLNKVCTSDELQLVINAKDKHRMFWRLWSMKEAAYKNHLQQYPTRFFNPKRITCQILNDSNGLARIDQVTSFTYSTITDDYVHTTATLTDISPQMVKIYRTSGTDPKTQSVWIKDELIKSISNDTGLKENQLSILKSSIGVPVIYFKSKPLNISFSLSHCGRYVGYAIY